MPEKIRLNVLPLTTFYVVLLRNRATPNKYIMLCMKMLPETFLAIYYNHQCREIKLQKLFHH